MDRLRGLKVVEIRHLGRGDGAMDALKWELGVTVVEDQFAFGRATMGTG
jgi:hypothetical protein